MLASTINPSSRVRVRKEIIIYAGNPGNHENSDVKGCHENCTVA